MENDRTTFGRYELVRQIGRGGMAEVFLAVERGIEGLERQVAIKRILPHMVEAEDFVSMFMDEARIAARLTHPNITHIYNFGEVGGVYFLAMEYIEGLACSRLLRLARPEGMPVAIGLRVAADVCAALHYAHELRDRDGALAGLVHRDVNPQNVMISKAGVAKLLDFGVARASTQSHATKVGQVKGKISYIAPEVFQGKPLDRRADVFSAGALLFELISGVKLFKREVEAATVAAILGDAPPPLAGLKGVPPGVDPIIRKAVEKDAGARYATAYEMQIDLEQLIAMSGQVATPFIVGRFVASMMERAAADDRAAEAAAERAGLERLPTEHDLSPSSGSSESGASGPGLEDLLRQIITSQPGDRDEAATEISRPGAATASPVAGRGPQPPDPAAVSAALELPPVGLAGRPTIREVPDADTTFDMLLPEADELAVERPDTDRSLAAADASHAIPDEASLSSYSQPSYTPEPAQDLAAADTAAQRRTTMVLVAAAVVGLLAIVGAVGLILAFDTPEPPGPTVVASQGPGVASPLPPLPAPVGPVAVPLADAGAARDAAPLAEAGPRSDADAAAPPAGKAPPQPAAMGKLYLHTSPWSKVRVGSRNLGTTPIVGASLPAGSHTLHLEDATGRRFTRKVQIRPGSSTKAFFELQ